MRGKRIIPVLIFTTLFALGVAGLKPDMVFAADSLVVDLNSGEARGAGYVAVNENFRAESDGTDYRLIMNGLKVGNKTAFINAVAQNFNPEVDRAIKIVDEALPDAEKYDVDLETDIDSSLCWAASVANQLWVSGWAEHLTNPETGLNFSSEDEVFTYYNNSFTNYGCSSTNNAIDWFFMGEFYNPSFSRAARLLDETNPENGRMKSFVSSRVQDVYDLVADPGRISKLIDCGGLAIYQASIGPLAEGKISDSSHSVIILGIIINPNASPENPGEYYKGVLIADSDNDAYPVAGDNPTAEQIKETRYARPNSVTLYPLSYGNDVDGKPFWEIMGYDTSGKNETLIIYKISRMSMYDESLITANTETEGNKSVITTPDFTLEFMFTTDVSERIVDLFAKDIDELTVNEFEAGQPVNLSFFVGQRSPISLDLYNGYLNEGTLSADWKVVRKSDNKVVASGRQILDDDISYNIDTGFLIHLNESDGQIEKWASGEYIVTVDLNTDRKVEEAYYLNNIPLSYSFTITGNEEASDDETKTPGKNDVQTGDKSDITFWSVVLGLAVVGCVTSFMVCVRKSE